MMIQKLLTRVFGSRHERAARKLIPLVEQINGIYEQLHSLSDEELRAKTAEFRARVKERTAALGDRIAEIREQKRHSEDAQERESLSLEMGEVERQLHSEIDAVLDELLPEAYATVKEACRRCMGREILVTGQKMVWDMVPFDVQLVGAIALHRGKVAEMATGEGKTLVATMPLYLNALADRGAHLVTVNAYLAQRDAEWMGTIYNFLGVTVDCIDLYEPGSPERRTAYRADITYGTNNEFGFDYLRDNMVHSLEQRVQRGHFYAIIDEVDSILIDEARTPLIISGPVGRESSEPFKQYNPLVANLYRRQTRIVNELVAEAEKKLAESEEYEAGVKLLAARRGAPRHKRLLKLFADDPGLQKLVQRVEADYMRDKRLHEVDELLLFAMDEKGHSVHLSDAGVDELSPGDAEAFVVPDLSEEVGTIERDETLPVDEKRARIAQLEREYAEKSEKVHVIHQLLKAYTLFQKDEQYIIGEDGSIVIVDEFTGRQMPGRRWSDGLHQAVEAKEGVEVRGETQTLATITIQNYFRMYDKLAGMTGTAETEEAEFHQIYGLEVTVIPTHRPVIRSDFDDLVFRTKREKYNAIMDEIERLHLMSLPVLVGTTNVEVSETLARMLKRRGIAHNVLNAKHHRREAEIVAGAGQPGAVTIATNMAGRGTDIKLGPGVTEPRTVEGAKAGALKLEELAPVDPGRWADLEKEPDDYLIECGGLHIVGSERHEARRIDRQLRGRSGRQGDPGATQFFLSLEDDLMRLFGSERIAAVMEKMGAQEGEVITHPLVTRSIERAQRRVELNNFEARKRLLEYDDVMNQQREVIYDLRLFALEGGEDLKGEVWEMIEHAMRAVVNQHAPEDAHPEEWDLAGLRRRLLLDYFFGVGGLPQESEAEHEITDRGSLTELVLAEAREAYHRKLKSFGDAAERLLSYVMLSVMDEKWKDHLYDLDHLKASIGFRGWGQKDPLLEYKKEAYDMFVDLMADMRRNVASLVYRAQIAMPEAPPPALRRRLLYTGPSEVPAERYAREVAETHQPVGAGAAARIGELGVARTARADVVAALPGRELGGGGPDLRQLVTNRGEERRPQPVTVAEKVGRNDPCPCGSGKKYKKCHGAKG
ncbi:MAG: preprotein translocase subunit SecA [Gemmatimonadetes bacterium]|nr:preprotein translocase subunit SecA [Gemmatimonadota bacterium]